MTMLRKAAFATLGIAAVVGAGLSSAATAGAAVPRIAPVEFGTADVVKASQRIRPPHNPHKCVRTYRKVPDGNGGYSYQEIRFCL